MMELQTLACAHVATTLPPTRSAPRYPRAAAAAAIAAAPTPETRLARAGRRGKNAQTASPDARTARRRIFSRAITPPPPEGRDAAARGPCSGTKLPLPRSPHRRGQRTTPLARCVAARRGPRPSTPPRHPPRSQSRGAPPPHMACHHARAGSSKSHPLSPPPLSTKWLRRWPLQPLQSQLPPALFASGGAGGIPDALEGCFRIGRRRSGSPSSTRGQRTGDPPLTRRRPAQQRRRAQWWRDRIPESATWTTLPMSTGGESLHQLPSTMEEMAQMVEMGMERGPRC